MKRTIFISLFGILFSVFPLYTYAQTTINFPQTNPNSTTATNPVAAPVSTPDLVPTSNFKATPYIVLAPLPGTTNKCESNGCTADINSYLGGFLNLIIGIGAMLSFLYFIRWGFEYATSDSATVKSSMKQKLQDTFIGFLLIISSYAIINTISPRLLNLNLNISTPTTSVSTGGIFSTGGGGNGGGNVAGTAMTQEQINQSNVIVKNLNTQSNGGISVYAGPCERGQPTSCVNLNGLLETTQSGLISLDNSCKCKISISGGTEAGHGSDTNTSTNSHLNGTSVDVQMNDPNLTNYITKNAIGAPVPTTLGPVYTVKVNGVNAQFLKESNPPHWHITFPPK